MDATKRDFDNLRMLAVMAAVGYVNLLEGAAEDVAALAQVKKADLLDGLTEDTATPEAIDCAHLTLMSMRPSEGERLTVQWKRVSRLYAGLKEWKRRKLSHPASVRGMVFFEERLAKGDERSQRMRWFDAQRALIMDRSDNLAGADAVEYWTVPIGSESPLFKKFGAVEIRFVREDYRCSVDGLAFYFFRCQHPDDVRPALCTACLQRLKASEIDPAMFEELRRLLVMAAFGHEKGLEGAAADIETILWRASIVGGSLHEQPTSTAEKLLEGLNPETSPVPDIERARITLRTLAGLTAAQANSYMELGRLAAALRQWVVPLAALPDERNPGAVKAPGPLRSMPNLLIIEGMNEAHSARRRMIEEIRQQMGRIPDSCETVEIPIKTDRHVPAWLRQEETVRFRRQRCRCSVHDEVFDFWRAEDPIDGDTDPRSGCARCALIMAMAFKKAPAAGLTGQKA